MIPQAT